MKQMSQEAMFSDVQLEDPDGRRNSNVGLFPDFWHLYFIYLFIFLNNFWFYCHLPNGSLSLFAMNTGNAEASRLQTSVSPADLHGMWYPTVRRTLVCLSKLYRCIDVSLQFLLYIDLLCIVFFFQCCLLCLGVFPESRLPGFISRSLICLHPVAA